MVVHELHYPKRACGKCKTGVSVASPPPSDSGAASLTAGSRYGFGVTAQIILGKYADHLPLYRLEDVFARAGVVIPRSTQVGLLDAAADLLTPLTELMKRRARYRALYDIEDRASEFSAADRLPIWELPAVTSALARRRTNSG